MYLQGMLVKIKYLVLFITVSMFVFQSLFINQALSEDPTDLGTYEVVKTNDTSLIQKLPENKNTPEEKEVRSFFFIKHTILYKNALQQQ